jgi:Family of unknown function (DUF6340)
MKSTFMLPALFTLAQLLVSCSSYINIQRPLSPEIPLSSSSNNIVFVNYFDYTNPLLVEENHRSAYREGINGLAQGISTGFSKEERVRYTIGDTLKRGMKEGMLTDIHPLDSVRKICSLFNADMLLALDSARVLFDWETLTEENEDGSKSKTKNFYIIFRGYLTTYTSAGDIINRSEVERSDLYTSRATLSGLITIKPALEKAADEVRGLALQAGSDYVSKFYPSVSTETKMLYGGKIFKESNISISNKDCTQVIEYLKDLTGSKDPKIAKKAAHNLEIAGEVCDDEVVVLNMR